MSFTSSPKGKLLAAIFVFLCAISTCLSSPVHHRHSVKEQRRRALEEKIQLYARASKGCADLLKDKDKRDGLAGADYSAFVTRLGDKGTTLVGVGEQKFKAFGDKPVTMGSSGFDGCIGIVITSPEGGIIAHYTATDEGTKKGTTALKELIKKNKKSFKPKETQAWVYANVRADDHKKFVANGQKDTFVKLIKDEVGVKAQVEKYLQISDMLEKELDKLNEEDAKEYDVKVGQMEQLISGAVLLENKGKGAASKVSFVNLKVQTAKNSCPA